ncbi:3-methyladenine DNA glycosylase Tag [Novosphingobium sp. 1529]|uniref:DNA-3-methyladenine glycosylase I n=1 Tax=Novosphingobium sp. 1529 TaxID=3156424 RepID=UPI003398D6AD
MAQIPLTRHELARCASRLINPCCCEHVHQIKRRADLSGHAKPGEDFAAFCWSFTGGAPILGSGENWVASTPLSETISKERKLRGFKFVGLTITFAWMQAVGIVNDHALGCFRRPS